MPPRDHDFADLDRLTSVETADQIAILPTGTEGLLVKGLDDTKLEAIAQRCPELRFLITDGNARVTDAGLAALNAFARLEWLDLEWSGVTDAGLFQIAAVESLRRIDLEFCEGVTKRGLDELRRIRPDLEFV